MPTPATALRTFRRRRHHAFEQLPQAIRHHPLHKPSRHHTRLRKIKSNEMASKWDGFRAVLASATCG